MDPRRPASSSTLLGPADQRLLSFLVRAGALEADRAREVVESGEGSLFDRLASAGGPSEADVVETLVRRLHLPVVDPASIEVDDTAFHLFDEATAEAFAVLPVALRDGTVRIVMANPLDREAVRRIEFVSGLSARISVAPRSAILRTIDERYRRERTLETMLADLPPAADVEILGGTSSAASDEDTLVREAEQAPVVKMVNLILKEALRSGASDVHVEPTPGPLIVRFRVNGVLERALEIPKWLQGSVVARLKVMARLDISERRVPQDGRLAVRHEERVVDVRVSTLPTSDGETVVLRVLDSSRTPWSLDAIGLEESDLTVLRRLVRRPQGMILVTGPTGSGKTTTLYAVLKAIYSPERKIVTIENPIEYKLPGVSQVNVNEKQGLTFGRALRSVLRQDPDVILVGEIRDRETAEVAFRAAQTGHLVLSTMHTNDTAATVTRLVDLGIEPFVISASLIAVVAQRLVRTVCQSCARPAEPEADLCRTLGVAETSGLREGAGCPECRHTGFASRTGCYEVMEVTRALRERITVRASEEELRSRAEKEGMRAIQRDAARKVELGRTTIDEALRVIEIDDGGRCGQCGCPVEEAFSTCPMCSAALRSECPTCRRILKEEWKSCPYCSSSVVPVPGVAREASRILVVDDHADIRLLVRRILQRESIPLDVDEAASGAEALEKIEADRPHLVILDVMMPAMDGYEVCKRMRSSLQTALVPILMLTARADPESRSAGFLAGTDDYLAKPFESEELRTRVRWLLDGGPRRAASANGAARTEPIALPAAKGAGGF